MMHSELEKIEREHDRLSSLVDAIVTATALPDAHDAAMRLARTLNEIALPYRVERQARSMDRGDTFHQHIASRPRAARRVQV